MGVKTSKWCLNGIQNEKKISHSAIAISCASEITQDRNF